MDPSRHMRWIKPPIFLLCLAPLGALGWKAYQGNLGANPVELITHSTGTWTLVGLCVTLAITPLRKILHLNWLVRFRRMFGLFAFFYGCLHFTTYIWLDQFFDFHSMIKDVYKRPFITMGFTAFVLMWPLALTSTKGMIRRLGGKRWAMLHRLIYVSAIAGVIHYYWLVKIDESVPLRFAAVVTVLLGYRLVSYFLEKKNRPEPPGRVPSRPVKTETALPAN
jgi:methionine sulfoxide reductase heme-binding subunit